MNEKVSIVIATYHRCDLLPRAVRSASEQTYKNVEIIVVDDNPPESEERLKTEKVMEELLRGDERIIYLRNEKNAGGAVSRNNGIARSTGEYVAFLDDDDEYLPERIEVQLREMLARGWDVSVMDGATYDDDGNEISVKKQRLSNGMSRDELMRVHMKYHISGTNTFMFKAEKLRGIGGFDDLPACQEYVLMQKAIEAGLTVGYVERVLIKNHISPGERLSTSLKKVPAQKLLLSKKKEHFDLLSRKERRAVICRHHGVLFNIYLKNKKYANAFASLAKCVLVSPSNAWRWYKEYKNKIGN